MIASEIVTQAKRSNVDRRQPLTAIVSMPGPYVSFPPWVVNWDYELASSEEGDAAVWVNVFAEGNVARSDYGRFGSQIIPVIREALAAEGVRRWPYVRLRTAMEYQTA